MEKEARHRNEARTEEKVHVNITSSEDASQSKSKESNTSSAGTKKTAKNKTKPLYFWNSGDVNKWLRKHGGGLHEKYGDTLLQQEVTGRTLIRMNEIKLEKIGISRPEHRKELMQHILRLRLKHEMIDLKNLDQKGTGFELKLPDSKAKHQVTKENRETKDKH